MGLGTSKRSGNGRTQNWNLDILFVEFEVHFNGCDKVLKESPITQCANRTLPTIKTWMSQIRTDTNVFRSSNHFACCNTEGNTDALTSSDFLKREGMTIQENDLDRSRSATVTLHLRMALAMFITIWSLPWAPDTGSKLIQTVSVVKGRPFVCKTALDQLRAYFRGPW